MVNSLELSNNYNFSYILTEFNENISTKKNPNLIHLHKLNY